MKRLFGVLNLILCLELIIGPNFPGMRIFSVEVAKAETCPSGLVFDSTLNRCITSDQQATLMNATASCNGDQECYKRLAEEELKKGEDEGKIEDAVKNKSGLINSGLKAAAVALPLIIAAKSLMGSTKCLSTGKIAMAAGGVALFVGDMMANKKHKSCLKKIEDEWEKKKTAADGKTSSGISKVNTAGAQSEAFEMLAKKEECMQSAAKMKAGFYAASTAAFAATAVMAVMEILKEKSLFTAATQAETAQATACAGPQAATLCAPATTTATNARAAQVAYTKQITCEAPAASMIENNFNQSNDFELYAASHNIDSSIFEGYDNFYRRLPSDGFNFPLKNEFEANTASLIINKIISEFSIQSAHASFAVGTLLVRPEPRGVASGVLAAWSLTMMTHANKQARVAKNRAEFLRNLKKEFDEANGAISCTEEERSTTANANCYCYTESGQRNSARSNSQICQQLWSGKNLGTPGSFAAQDFSTQRVCIAANGSPDENCACKQSKNCLSAIPGTSGSLGIGAISVASNGLQPLSDLTNGQIGAGNINGSAAGNLAARLLDEKNKLASKAKLDSKKQSNLSKQIEGALITSAAGQPSPIQDSAPLPFNMSPSAAAEALEKELGSERSFERIGGPPALAQPGDSSPGDEQGFSLGTSEEPVATTETQVAEAMTQNLDYGQNDITKSDSNIFNILSNRYQRSGMRRLFDENNNSKPEPAARSDIAP